MKTFLSLLTILLFSLSMSAQQDTNKSKDDESETFIVVEQMPRFPGCEESNISDNEKQICAKTKLITYILDNLVYPQEAKKKDTNVKAIVQFVINTNGEVDDLKLIRDPGFGCGEAALAVMGKMKEEIRWIPGVQRGRKVKVKYTLPIDFKQ